MPDSRLVARMAPRSKTTVLILAAVVLSVVVALQLRGTWIGIGVTLEPSDTFTDQPSDELVIEPDATFVRVFHNGCNETYRYSVEETADEIWVLAEMRQQSSCLLYTSPSPRDKRQSRMPSSA